jgi:hypothetical protein
LAVTANPNACEYGDSGGASRFFYADWFWQAFLEETHSDREQDALGLLLLVRRFKDVHADDQAIFEPIAVENPRIGDELACVRVVDHLVDVDRDGPIRLLGEALGLDLAGDGGELSGPVLADSCAANHPTTLPGVGPIDLGIQQLDRGLDSRALNAR